MTIDTDPNNTIETSQKVTDSTPSEAAGTPNSGITQQVDMVTELELLENYAEYVRQSALTTSDHYKQMLRLFILALVEAEIGTSD